MAMEVNPTLAASSLDVSNAIGEIERECIEAAIRADTYMHRLLPLFELLYKHGEGVLWYYDENGKFVVGVRNRRGFRQGCVLGMFLFCVTMQPIYARLQEAVGEEGALYTYCDDSYLLAPTGRTDGHNLPRSAWHIREGWPPHWLRAGQNGADPPPGMQEGSFPPYT